MDHETFASALHQVLPSFRPGNDGIGNHVLLLQRVFQSFGFRSEIYAETIATPSQELATPFELVSREEADPNASFLYHHSTGSRIADWFSHAQARRAGLWFHNVTPPRLFGVWDERAAKATALGWQQLRSLVLRADLLVTHTHYSAGALREAGATSVAIIPPLIDLQRLHAPRESTLRALRRSKRPGGVDLLFVGRITPNKGQHVLIRVLADIRRSWDPLARLTLVGRAYSPRYVRHLKRLCAELNLTDAVRFTGAVPDDVLAAHYSAADVFVSMSAHEGFGVPLVEAMHMGVPVIANDNSAVGETLGPAGVLMSTVEPIVVSDAIREVVARPILLERMTRLGRRRARLFSMTRTRKALEATFLHNGWSRIARP